MLWIEAPLRDVQQAMSLGQCRVCGGELYRYDPWPLCRECWREQHERRNN